MSQLSGSADNVPFHGSSAAPLLRAALVTADGTGRRFVRLIRTTHWIAGRFTRSGWQFSGAWQFATQRTCQRKTDQPELILPGESDAPLILPRNSQKNACGRISGSASFIPAINQTQRRKPGCANIARHSGRLLSSSPRSRKGYAERAGKGWGVGFYIKLAPARADSRGMAGR